MANGKFYGFISDMPPWGKAVVVIGTLSVMTVIGVTVYKKINQAAKNASDTKKSDALNSNTQSAIDALASKNIYPTATQEQYNVWASSLDACFQGWGHCGSYKDVFSSLNNEADVHKLIQAFGIRTIDSGRFNPTPNLTGDLSAVLTDELFSWQLSDVNKILDEKGIKFKF